MRLQCTPVVHAIAWRLSALIHRYPGFGPPR